MMIRIVGPLALLASAVSCSAPAARPVNLLQVISPDRDAVSGTWAFDGNVLVTGERAFNRLRIPVIPPEEYDVRAVIEPQGSNSMNLGLVGGGKSFMVILDGSTPPRSGLDLVDGKPFYQNPTTISGVFVPARTRGEVVCAVRRNSVRVSVEGKVVIDWKEGFDRLSLYQGWSIRGEPTLMLGTWSKPVRYHALELIPVTGTPRILKAVEME